MARMKELQGTALGEFYKQPGELTEYRYEETDGELAFIVARIDPPEGGKEVRPFTPDGDAGLPERYAEDKTRPLHNLPALARARSGSPSSASLKVVVVEGEKCAEAARAVFPDCFVTTWQGGSYAIDKTNWKALNGMEVLLISDTDEPGRLAMLGIVKKLSVPSMTCTVRIYGEAGDDKTDIADWAKGLGKTGLAELRQKIEGGAVLPKDFGKDDSQPSNGRFYTEDEPWPAPVDGGELLSDIARLILEHMDMEKEQADTATLWVPLAWIHDHPGIEVAPFLNITAPTKRAGKSTLLEIVGEFVPRAETVTNFSASYLFRVIDRYKPTLLLDEVDRWKADNDFTGIVNGSQKRSEAFVGRSEERRSGSGKTFEPVRYPTWCPKVLCGIGGLLDTTIDRCIQIRLDRSPKRPKHWRKHDKGKVKEIRSKLARWTADNQDALVAGRNSVSIPEGLTDRQEDSWELLFSIANAAGGKWSERARKACLFICGSTPDNRSWRELLIGDVRAVFKFRSDPDFLSTGEILGCLNRMEERPWPRGTKGKQMHALALSRSLKPFDIQPRQKRVTGESNPRRGYYLSDIGPVAARYPVTEGDNPLEILQNMGNGQRSEEPM